MGRNCWLINPPRRSIDILASKLVFNHQSHDSSSRSRPGATKSYPRQFTSSRKGDVGYTNGQGEHVVQVHGGPGGGGGAGGGSGHHRTSSQERIIERSGGSSARTTPSDIDLEMMDPNKVGISKTVEFEVYETNNRI